MNRRESSPSPAETNRQAPPAEASPRLAPDELTGLLAAVQEATGRLESSHTQLLAKVNALTRDLSEANAQLERSRRLAALGEMAAGIAHEIRNPLGCVRLYASMLTQDLADRPPQAALAGKITSAARAMEGIVADVLTFSREFRLRAQPVTASDLFDRSLEQCCHDGVHGWRGVEIVRADRSDEDGVLTLDADADLLIRAVTNIIRNAFEAMHELPRPGGLIHRLTLGAAARPVAGNGGRAVRCAVLSVDDTGPGVSDDVVSRMFNPFFTTRHTGTGLGLAIVHRIVDAHGGRVHVQNNTGGPGARVELILPLRASEGVVGPETPGARHASPGQPLQTERAA